VSSPVLHVVAGPNGAGKSTFVQTVLQAITRLPFINAVEIAALRWPGEELEHTYEASAAAADARGKSLSQRRSFMTETVFSPPSKVELISHAKAAGYIVSLTAARFTTTTVRLLRCDPSPISIEVVLWVNPPGQHGRRLCLPTVASFSDGRTTDFSRSATMYCDNDKRYLRRPIRSPCQFRRCVDRVEFSEGDVTDEAPISSSARRCRRRETGHRTPPR
jgi:hypothetical protein